MDAASPVFDYRLSADGVVLSLGDDWLRFARENGAPELTRDSVIGHSVWEYVAGESTRELYEMMFLRVLDREKLLVLPFRCDSPDRFRFMTLSIEPAQDHTLQLSGRLVRDQARPYLKLLDRLVTRSTDPLGTCSVCLRVKLFEETWVETEEAVERLKLFDSAQLPPLDYRVCPDCAAFATGSIETARGASA
jgi:hypothetical protein